MPQFLRIIVATSDDASRNLISRVVAQQQGARIVAEADDDAALLEAVAYRRPQLIFLSTDLADMRGFDVADRLSRQYPGVFLVLITPRKTVEEIRRAMKAGARECLFEPITEEAVLRLIDEARSAAQSAADRRGTIVAVMSSKGGVGKSTITVNLAIALKQLRVGRVAVVDGDLYFGDLATLLNIKPEHTIHDLNKALDVEIADRFLHRHASGIEVLAAPLRTEQAEEIPPERFRTVLGVLQTLYDYVVVDATVSAFDTMLATLDVADLAIVLTTLDVICLKDVSQVIEMLAKLRFPAHNIALVGNRFDERFSVNPRDAERTLGLRFAGLVPRDDRVIASANRGVPMILEAPGAPFTRRVLGLARTVVGHMGRLQGVTA
ncbi:MAG: P-loop NTPase [Armatimonadota bacterium]|nr:P-loop NTPase [Armatimonadota bacterium]MDR7463311.1 P-loop NTPase [Armatimonadota bacterium]MDR7468955.1 P-loop NTPase [Armatimonadota bacterium]MDR7474000.1 P-loop NTPase [Armatimonadota bacterium]MDR7537995.1 P-loop NTPase [Armatimonadota bacterium]